MNTFVDHNANLATHPVVTGAVAQFGGPNIGGVEANPAHFTGGPSLPVSRGGEEGGGGYTAGKEPAKPGMTEGQQSYIDEIAPRMPEVARERKGEMARAGTDTSFVRGHQSDIEAAPTNQAPEPGILERIGGAISGAVKYVAGHDANTGTTLTPSDSVRLGVKR